MDPEIKKLLLENLELTRENNKLLRKVRGYQRWQQFTRILHWVVIIGLALGAFYYLEPYLKRIEGLYNDSTSTLNSLKNLSGTDLSSFFGGSLPKQTGK